MIKKFANWLVNKASKRPPDFIVGGKDNPYMLRWYLIPKNPFIGAYVHRFLRSDDDRALHDHPWPNVSLILDGTYTEHTIQLGGIHKREIFKAGDLRFRFSGKFAHRIELHDGPVWTLFIRGPKYRKWGFHCPERGWVYWKDFVAPDDKGSIGPGCGEEHAQ